MYDIIICKKKFFNVALDKHLKKKYDPRGSKGCQPLLYSISTFTGFI
jgi:hypothetical protein